MVRFMPQACRLGNPSGGPLAAMIWVLPYNPEGIGQGLLHKGRQ
jgi:hypothetical protein